MTPETKSALRLLSAAIVEPEYRRIHDAAMYERIRSLESRVESLAEENEQLGKAIVKLSQSVVWVIPARRDDPSTRAGEDSSPKERKGGSCEQ